MRYRNLISVSFFLLNASFAFSQGQGGNNTNNYNPIRYGVPFITVAPDARSGAMGEIGAATTADANSIYWNSAKLAFLENNSISASYSPWLRKLLPNASMIYFCYGSKINERNGFGASIRYFNAGTSDLYSEGVVSQGSYHPMEFSFDVALARKFGDNFSISLTGRYIYSRLGAPAFEGMSQVQPGQAIAADVGFFYKKRTQQFQKDADFSAGINISNIGTKIEYALGQQNFLPANLRVGISNRWYLDEISDVALSLDLNKLLVPSPPVRDNEGKILKGNDDNISSIGGVFSSFSDAPGGLREELRELSAGVGLDYNYNRQFQLRFGYYYENPNKGNRRYITVGPGLSIENMQFDFSYIFANQQKSTLANTLRFSLTYKL